MSLFKQVRSKLLPAAAVSVLTAGLIAGAGFQHSEQAAAKKQPDKNEIRNVIFMVGDGMGAPYMNAYRSVINKGKPSDGMKLTAFDPNLAGMMMTYPDDPDSNITDSAAAGTAMATGVKTYNAAIGVDKKGKRVKSVLEEAKQRGNPPDLSQLRRLPTPPLRHSEPITNPERTWMRSQAATLMTASTENKKSMCSSEAANQTLSVKTAM